MDEYPFHVQTYNPAERTQEELLEDYRIVVTWWEQRGRGEFTYSEEQLINIATVIFNEMIERGIEPPDPQSVAEEQLVDLILNGKINEEDMAYKEEFSVTVNRIGTIDCDAVKGCWGSCYGGACYALQTAQRFGWDFHKPKIRYFEEGQRQKFMNQIQKAAKDEKKKWARIGVMGDPSISWSNTVAVAGLIKDAGITPIIISKHRRTATQEQLRAFKDMGAILHTSVCMLDGPVWKRRYEQALRFGRMGGKSLVRLVTYEGNDADNAEMQRIIKECPLIILETPLRIPKTNPLVVSGRVLNPNKPVKLTDRVCAAEPPFDCRACKEQCGVDYRYKFPGKDQELAPVLPSEKPSRERIFLRDVLPHFKSFYTAKPSVYLVGGICNNQEGGTEGDIDILIREPEPAGNEKLPLLFRLYRLLPPELRSRLHVCWSNEDFGPFTNHIPLYDTLYERTDIKQVILMSADEHDASLLVGADEVPDEGENEPPERMKPDKKASAEESATRGVKPFRFFMQLKGIAGYRKQETYSLEGLKGTLKESDYPYEVDEKFDGMRVQAHKKGDEVKVYSINGENITGRLPEIVSSLKGINHDFVLDAEMTGKEGDRILGRSDVAGYVHAKEAIPENVKMTLNAFDIIHMDGKSLHKEPLSVRRKVLEGLPRKLPGINIIPVRRAKNWEQMASAIKWASAFPGSEGAMIKSLASLYPLTGMTSQWIKFKKEADLDAEVIEVHAVKGGSTWNYLCVLRNRRGEAIPVGRTYNTPIKATKGDIVRVAFGNLNEYTDPKSGRTWFNWVFPRVIELREDKKTPDNDLTAHQIYEQTKGESGEKSIPTVYKSFLKGDDLATFLENCSAEVPLRLPEGVTREDVAELGAALDFQQAGFLFDADPFSTPAPENKKWKFVFQLHFRGKSVHGDLRLERPSFLVGWTMNLQKEGEPSKEVLTLEEAVRFARDTSNVKDPHEHQLVVEKKELQPLEWLNVKAAYEPGEVGSTKQFPSVFLPVVQGEVEYGTQKPYYHEYFLTPNKGAYRKMYSGRFVVRLLENTWGGKAGRGKFVWMMWATKEQTPYIITRRAVSLGEMPPRGLSWLPQEVRKRIPKQYRYWTMSDQKKAKEARDALVDAIKKNEVTLDAIEDLPNEGYFLLTEICWRGPIIVRGGCSRTENVLFLQIGQKKLMVYLDGNPIRLPKVAATIGEKVDKKWSHLSGKIPNESLLNPDKKTPASQTRLAQGKFKVTKKDPARLEITFDSKEFKGRYVLRQTRPGTSLWVFEKAP